MEHATTIFELLSWAGDVLKRADASRTVPQNARLDAQVLFAHVLGVNSAYLFTHGDEAVCTSAVDHFHRLVMRRSRHEPVAYLTQTKAFFGRDFFVNSSVLIPRPDTEVLVEHARALITPSSTVIDIGTGSGAIAVTLACETHAQTFAIDVDPAALTIAEHNAQTHGATIHFLQGSLLEPWIHADIPAGHLVITANLPYLTPWQWKDLDPDVRDYEPRLALVGGADGLVYYDELCTQLRTYLHEQSRQGHRIAIDLLIEIDQSQRLTAPSLLQTHFPDSRIVVHRDLSGKERVVHMHL